MCEYLNNVELNEGLEAFGCGSNRDMFFGTGVAEITLPSTLKFVVEEALWRSEELKVIYVKSNCQIDLSQLHISPFTEIRDYEYIWDSFW